MVTFPKAEEWRNSSTWEHCMDKHKSELERDRQVLGTLVWRGSSRSTLEPLTNCFKPLPDTARAGQRAFSFLREEVQYQGVGGEEKSSCRFSNTLFLHHSQKTCCRRVAWVVKRKDLSLSLQNHEKGFKESWLYIKYQGGSEEG